MPEQTTTLRAPDRQDRVITILILGFWALLICFALISLMEPDWLKEISDPGRRSEALDIKHQADDFLKQGNYGAAIAAYRQVLEREPDLYAAAGNLGIVYMKTKRYDEALKTFHYILNHHPDNPGTIYHNMAEVYELLEDPENALDYYTRCARVSPQPGYALAKRGFYLLQLARPREAIEAFQQSLDSQADLMTVYRGNLAAGAFSFPENSEQRLAVLRHLEQPFPTDFLQRFDHQVFAWKLRTDRERAKTHNFMGIAHTRLGEIESGRGHFEAALEIWPDFRDALKNRDAIARLQSQQPAD